MTKPLVAILVVALTLASCGRIRDSRLNPFNWFGRSQPAAVVPADPAAPRDGRQLVAEVTELELERTAGGVIVRATGLPPRQGFWDAELVARPVEDGVLIYDFRIAPPPRPTDVNRPRSREVVVAAFLSDRRIADIRQITVQGERSARSARR